MKKIALSVIGGFVTNNTVATVVALLILNPLLNPSFEGTVRSMEQGLNTVPLTGGYLLLSVMMTWLYRQINWTYHWATNGLILGSVTGSIVFVSGHLIVSGWSILPATPMFISGILDCLATIAAGIFIAFIYRHGNH